MARDALDPGPDGTYPYFPRRADGTPYWSENELTDGEVIMVNGVRVAPMPRGLRTIYRGGSAIAIDVTPTTPDGTPINPPVLP